MNADTETTTEDEPLGLPRGSVRSLLSLEWWWERSRLRRTGWRRMRRAT